MFGSAGLAPLLAARDEQADDALAKFANERLDRRSAGGRAAAQLLARAARALMAADFPAHAAERALSEMARTLGEKDLVSLQPGVVTVHFNQEGLAVRLEANVTTNVEIGSRTVDVVRLVADECLSAEDALLVMDAIEARSERTVYEHFANFFPGRLLPVMLVAVGSPLAFLNGSTQDLKFAAIAGLVSGLWSWACDKIPELRPVAELGIGVLLGLTIQAFRAWTEEFCVTAVLLGALWWYYYGVNLAVAMLDINQGKPLNGAVRLLESIVNSFVISFGAVAGVYAGSQFAPKLTPSSLTCRSPEGFEHFRNMAIAFPFVAWGGQMQLRVPHQHAYVCFVLQVLTLIVQFQLTANADLASIASNVGAAAVLSAVTRLTLLILPSNLPTGVEHVDLGLRPSRPTDPWLISLPALYNLVPGSTLFKDSFLACLTSITEPDEDQPVVQSGPYFDAGSKSFQPGNLFVSLLAVAISLVCGVVAGDAAAAAIAALVARITRLLGALPRLSRRVQDQPSEGP